MNRNLGPQFDLPPEPGSVPIPEGHIRLWHYTRDHNLDSIRQSGLVQGHAQGHTYGEPDMIWAAAGTPDDDQLRNHNYVEFHANPGWGQDLDIGAGMRGEDTPEHISFLESRRAHVTMRGDVPPERIIGVHQPWHWYVHHIESEPRMLHDYTEGDFKDWDTGDEDADRAIRFIRDKHRRGGYQ